MNKELEEAIKILNIATGKEKGVHVYQDTLNKAIEKALNYIDNSIPKEVIEKKIKELEKCKVKKAYKDKNIIGASLENMRIITINSKIQALQEILEGK